MIKIDKICKQFDKNLALDDISLSVNDGEILGVLGENGAGKTTLLRIISTIMKPTSGNVLVNNADIKNHPDQVRKNIGILFSGGASLYERLSVKENLYYFAELNGMDKKSIEKRIKDLDDIFKFSSYINKKAAALSTGMKQKVAIVRSIIHDPPVILFDEPDSGLDFGTSKIIFDFLEFCKNEKKSIIFSSHSLENIRNFSDRLAILHAGKLIKILNMEELRNKNSVTQINDMLFNLVFGGQQNV
jgi:sodium transport system ATP-binding protein